MGRDTALTGSVTDKIVRYAMVTEEGTGMPDRSCYRRSIPTGTD